MTGSPAEDGSRIVVGVDGSDSSKAALRWAVRQARLTGAQVEAVTAWHFPAYYGWVPPDGTDVESMARSMLDEVIADTAGPEPGVEIQPIVRQGNAAQVLLEEAKDAELLVVGSRGHGGFAEALLGSVGQNCVHHASCPVVVVRDQLGRGTRR